jgi:hypothetical protein
MQMSDIKHRTYARHGVSFRAFAREVAREHEVLRLIREEAGPVVRANVASYQLAGFWREEEFVDRVLLTLVRVVLVFRRLIIGLRLRFGYFVPSDSAAPRMATEPASVGNNFRHDIRASTGPAFWLGETLLSRGHEGLRI